MTERSTVIDANKDFYKILNVEKTATEAEIKVAYRKLAIKYHPDRNDGSPEAAERFKEISIAYAVLSDPNRRRQYDLFGPSNALVDFEGFDIGQMSGLRRLVGALCTQIGIPVPTQILPRVLGIAKDIVDNKHDPSVVQVESLAFGEVSSGRVERQDAKFYRISFGESEYNKGIIISCRSSSMSKFKLVLFDRDGNVRLIRESAKHKRFTSAEMFFLPFDLMRVTEFFSLKFLKEVESEDVPIQFHLLDGFEPDQCIKLQPGEHLFCVYGDNWFQDIKYKVRVMVADCDSPPVQVIRDTEAKLSQYKQEMIQFKDVYMLAKKQFEEAIGKLEHYTDEITNCLKNREKAYIDFINASGEKYSSLNLDSTSQKQHGNGAGGIFKGILNSFTGSISGK
ncbi:DnaJ domain protein [Trichuris suis]|uniref:J domain-containing protein n=1 Tax=Trichuris suis TaxID=68888 RepID=A0A085MLM2_9BILA|nr:hypothetical protein M513_00881 [Trichuris suis]KHJ47545.1 DnaJ domain protein [Trichuris suis]